MFGSPGSLATVAISGTSTSTALSLTTGGVVEATIFTEIVIGGTASALVTVNYLVSLDGTNYLQDGPSISFVPTASTTYWYTYYPPDSAQSVQVQIVNGATAAITALVQGSTLAVS
jgi:hypothetical protein